MATRKKRSLELLEVEIVQFEDSAATLESLIPHLTNQAQKNLARAEVKLRRSRARVLRHLLAAVKPEQ